MMTRPSREFAVAHGAQLSAERLLGDDDAELLEDPLRQIDQPPAHHAMDRRDRATFDHADDRLALHVIELGGLAGRFAVEQTNRRNTQSRMICKPTPPIFAASVRVAPS